MVTGVADIGYGRQFEGWYDRLIPDDRITAEAVKGLADRHPAPEAGTLEFGVGTGRIAIPLSRSVGHVTGVDSSPEMLDALRAKLKDGGDVTPVHGDIRTYTSESRYGMVYSVCATLSCLTTPEDQRRAVRRAADLLVPGGRLVVETHNKPAILDLHEGQTRTTYFVPYPEPGTGVQTHSTLLDGGLWHCSHILYQADGTTRVGSELTRLTTPEDVDGYARAAGLEPEARMSRWDGTPYSEGAPMFMCSYVKP
ncbi:class I SAM-dependent methyltransferase [Streptomyces coeruleorubidus]|uniref:Class I SAM-dependent methyltransferase n=1 Tax=Streptomyces coeruleorubidus TaxID=116188 RepID=A0ABZ0KF03_STRC4|nr:class I SAM-dependent methyltransferase [Streptomyces coeruleorubidus]WOT36405.1 class I SAM-dependent methyltransferase [Streptomyces coeruleorubidus]